MASFSPLVVILNQNKLTGSNYVDQKRNLDIVLTTEEHKYVLIQPCPNFPSLDAPLEEKQRCNGWQKSNEMAKRMRQIYNTKMAEGTSVKEHCLRMISHLNTLEVLGVDIDGESQADLILQSLLESFKEFKLNYKINKKIYTLSELMNELVAAESILGTSSVNANMAEASTSQPKSKCKGKKEEVEGLHQARW